MAERTKNCPECAKKGKVVAMKLDKRQRPASGAMFTGEDMWVCSCGHAEEAED